MNKYHVYYCPEGGDISYVGDAPTLRTARKLMRSGATGLPRQYWATARAAGQVCGLYAPDDENESAALEWGGPRGDHCIVRNAQ